MIPVIVSVPANLSQCLSVNIKYSTLLYLSVTVQNARRCDGDADVDFENCGGRGGNLSDLR